VNEVDTFSWKSITKIPAKEIFKEKVRATPKQRQAYVTSNGIQA